MLFQLYVGLSVVGCVGCVGVMVKFFNNTVIYYAFKCNYLTRMCERELECTCTFKRAVIDEDGIDRVLLFVCVEKTHSANFLRD